MKLNYKKTLLVGFAFFLICAFWQAYDSIMPLMLVNKFGLSQTASGLIMAVDNIIAIFMLPLFGSLSDKVKTKWGRRTPFIVLGTIVAVVAFCSLTFADSRQLANLNANDKMGNSVVFYEELFESNYQIANAESSIIGQGDVPEKFTIKDYASQIVFQKNYNQLNETEKAAVKDWYTHINYEYLTSDGHTAPETSYGYENGEYFAVKTVVDDAGVKTYYRTTAEGDVKVEKFSTHNAYTNLVNPAISSYAWGQTKANPVPFILFVILLLVTLLAMATFRSPAVALMPDVTPKPLRSQANAIINLMGTVGGMLVLVLGIVFKTGKTFNQYMGYTWYVVAVCAIMVVALAMFIWKVKEPKWAEDAEKQNAELEKEQAPEAEQAKAPSADEKPHVLSKAERKSLILLLASVALWFIGYNAVTSKYSLYATNVLHMDYNTTLLIAQGAAIAAYLPVGLLAQKIGRKRSIMSGIIMLATAFIGATFMNANSSVFIMNVLFTLAGIGWATINVNSFPMVVELAKGSDVGKYTGYYYTASMAAQIVTPLLSGFIMDVMGSMRPLFPYAAIFVCIAFVTMFFVKHGDSKPIAKKGLEALDADAD